MLSGKSLKACVCVLEREREGERGERGDRSGEREGEEGGGGGWADPQFSSRLSVGNPWPGSLAPALGFGALGLVRPLIDGCRPPRWELPASPVSPGPSLG